ncbi:MAG: potassium/proton antiporter [Lachnospiraceae bacterium]
MATMILLTGAVILLCLILHRLSNRIGVPVLLAFILLGMVFGSEGIVKIPFDNFSMAEDICTVALVLIMFYGGFGTNIREAKPVAGRAILLSSVGVVLTAALLGVFCFLMLKISLLESFLIGAVLSSTDAASVFSILRSQKLDLKYKTASLLELESGSNDPCAYMMTVVILGMMRGGFHGGQMVLLLIKQVTVGLVIGAAVAFFISFFLQKVAQLTDGFDVIFVFAMALLAYGGAESLGGNGYLSVYVAGLIFGNRPLKNKKALVHFFDGVTGLMQMLIFFLLGLLAFPSKLFSVFGLALAIAVFLTFVARPVTIFALLAPFSCSTSQKLLISWSGLRGAASVVFAILATVSPAYTKNDLFHIVLFVVLFSIGLQGTLLPWVAQKLDMIDSGGNVMKTFSDYSDEMPVEFVKISISKHHPWINQKVKEITSLPDLLFVLILRDKKRLVPNGDTVIRQGDVIVLSALSPEEELGVHLSEYTIEADSRWNGRPLSNVSLGKERLVLLLKREEKIMIPNGHTILRAGDILVISQA